LRAERALQQRRYCDAFELWRVCALKSCRRNAACGGDANRCLKRAIAKVPHPVQWQARQTILKATPANLGGPERAARQCMPREFYVWGIYLAPQAGRGVKRHSASTSFALSRPLLI
jgi:hypothetical protein